MIKGKCTVPSLPISNCLYYQSESTCLFCQENFVPSLEGEECVPVLVSQCSKISNYQCKKCQEGYSMDENHEIGQVLQHLDEISSDDERALLQRHLGMTQLSYSQMCFKTEDRMDFCATVIGFNKCGECQKGYFLDADSMCTKYPYQRIDNCF